MIYLHAICLCRCASKNHTGGKFVYKECASDWWYRRGGLLQDRLPVKFQNVKFKDPKFMKF